MCEGQHVYNPTFTRVSVFHVLCPCLICFLRSHDMLNLRFLSSNCPKMNSIHTNTACITCFFQYYYNKRWTYINNPSTYSSYYRRILFFSHPNVLEACGVLTPLHILVEGEHQLEKSLDKRAAQYPGFGTNVQDDK